MPSGRRPRCADAPVDASSACGPRVAPGTRGAVVEAAPGPVAGRACVVPRFDRAWCLGADPAAAEEETRALDETRVAAVAVEATHRTELDRRSDRTARGGRPRRARPAPCRSAR